MADGHTRAGFLGTGAATLGGAALAAAWRPSGADAQLSEDGSDASKAAEDEIAFGPAFYGEHFFLELAGVSGGTFVGSVEGGVPEGIVVTEKLGADNIQKKHLGGVKYNEVSFKFGMTQAHPGIWDWIKATLDHAAPTMSGSIKGCDADFRVKSVGEFDNALLTEIGLPACDGAAKDPAYMTIKFAPEITRNKKGSGKVSSAGATASNVAFKFEIDGLSLRKVSKVDAITIKQNVSEPAKIEVPNLKFTLPDENAQDVLDYFESFVIAGNNGDAEEREGALSFRKGTSTVSSFGLSHLGAAKVTPLKAGASEVLMETVMYCEDIRLD